MKIAKQLITPNEAKELLNLSAGNRNISVSKVAKYANEMKSGGWVEDTFEFIKISKEGFLLDGHHRLNAIIKAGVPINLNIVKGVDSEIMRVIDTGKSRNPGDAFKIHGIANANNLSAIISAIISYELGYSVDMNVGRNPSISNFDLIDRYDKDPEYWQELYKKTQPIYLKINKVIGTTIIGKYYHLFSAKHPDKVEPFFKQLVNGSVSNETINILRSTLIRNKISQKKLSNVVLNAFIIKTWNAYVTNTEFKILKFDITNHTMPTIK